MPKKRITVSQGIDSPPSADPVQQAHGRQSVVFLVRSDVKKELERGKRKFEQGDPEGARISYERALDLDSNCPIAYFYLGFTHHEIGNLEMAKEYYLQAIDLDKKQTLFLEHLARLHFELGEYSVCLVRFQEAQALGPIQPISYGLMGRAFYELDRYTEAVDCLERMLETEKDSRLRSIAQYYLILSHLSDQSMLPARAECVALLEEEMCEPHVHWALADRFQSLQCLSLARDLIQAMEEDSPETAERLHDLDMWIEEAESPLSKMFCSDEEQLLHQLHQVSRVGTDKIHRVLLSLAEVSSPLVRELVMEYCRRFGFVIPNSILADCLNGEQIAQEAALLYAASTYRREYMDLIVANLDHPSKEVQIAAARYLEKRGTLSNLSLLDSRMEIAEGASLRRQIQRAINQIKRRHTEQTDKLTASPPGPSRRALKCGRAGLTTAALWIGTAAAAIYVAIKMLLVLV